MQFNKVILMGHLTRDVETRYTPSGTAVAAFSIAINRQWTNESGEKQEEVCFVEVDAWGKTAEIVSQYFKKGNPILIEGRLKQDNWEDKNTGQKRSKLKVVCERFSFVGGNNGNGDGDGEERQQQPQRRQTTRQSYPQEAAEAPQPDPDEEDVPFSVMLDPRKAFHFNLAHEILHQMRKAKAFVRLLLARTNVRPKTECL